MHVNWESTETEVILNPRLPSFLQASIEKHSSQLKSFQGHIWLTTSGSTSTSSDQIKIVALSKQALLTSASAVNHHLEVHSHDRWVNPLPSFHVGGLSIWARAFLSQIPVSSYTAKWNVQDFYSFLVESQGTFTSLVPAQVFDLVSSKLLSPPQLRAVIVGGGALSSELYDQSVRLGWPLLTSYGLTECGSQVATAVRNSPPMQVLPHVTVKINSKGFICLKSPSLLTTYAFIEKENLHLLDPKKDHWFETEDYGELTGKILRLIGRKQGFIKIGGESANMAQLEDIFEKLKLELAIKQDCALIAAPCSRLGKAVHLVVEGTITNEIRELINLYELKVMPFEKIREVKQVEKIPRSPLGKILRKYA